MMSKKQEKVKMNKKRVLVLILAVIIALGLISPVVMMLIAQAAENSPAMEWGAVKIDGGGYVSGIVTGKKSMYARTDVGGAYRYDYETQKWDQMFWGLTEQDKGLLSVSAICIDPRDDDIIYILAGCAYFSDARTEIFKSSDGGRTFTRTDVTDLIQVHANGAGRQSGEKIAIDPDNPDVLYCGGDVNGLIKSVDGGKTWEYVNGYNSLGLFSYSVKWPTWTDHMANATLDAAYEEQNGISSVAVKDGKVYVATSVTGQANVHVADVGTDNFTALNAELPTNNFPSRISQDADGNFLISYIAGLKFDGSGGGIYKCDLKTGKVWGISPANGGFGACISHPDNANRLIASTCGVWSSQLWEPWSETSSPAWGEYLYRSEDGGQTWTSIYPGKMSEEWVWDPVTGEMSQSQLYDYLKDGGTSWVYGKAIHWTGSIACDPVNPERILVNSGNGVFEWDKIWTDDPEATFHSDGIEEVVALDLVSIPGGNVYSAIGDYDGFIHTDVNKAATQYKPNIGSTSAIAYCPQNPDVLVRYGEHTAIACYTVDGGETWNDLKIGSGGGRAAITQLSDGVYRIFKSNPDSSNVAYTDNFGQTWTNCTGIKGNRTAGLLADPHDPKTVYAYNAIYNAYWGSDPNKTAPTFEDAHYSLFVSTDYGVTFKEIPVGMYDEQDAANRIAYLEEGKIVLGAGKNGMYVYDVKNDSLQETDVFYCKSVGYGAPEKAGDMNTLYMWGMPKETDAEGIYRSQDAGKTWVRINDDSHQFGGTGNGNFIVGDMNTFGQVYMSTVGMGIIYGRLADGTQPVGNAEVWALKRYLLGIITDITDADVCTDGTVDVFDLVMLKRES
ncbi:MAG: 1,4-beta-glucanase [Oscillospiraceae bacterium]|jgi:photosystem II stability/assembly factor-like uncharacterized protein|nr:1,4-beta-glucanase [Oscillospiraceae bacterium]